MWLWRETYDSSALRTCQQAGKYFITQIWLHSQHCWASRLAKTLAHTSVKAGFMITLLLPHFPRPVFTHPVLLRCLQHLCRSVCMCVSLHMLERQLLRCITPAILHGWTGLVVGHAELMYGISLILLLIFSICIHFINSIPQRHRDYSYAGPIPIKMVLYFQYAINQTRKGL